MGDSVADREVSYTSLNRYSWGHTEEQRSTDTTPLLKRQKREVTTAPVCYRDGAGEDQAVGSEESVSYSALEERRRGSFVTRTVIGEVLGACLVN